MFFGLLNRKNNDKNNSDLGMLKNKSLNAFEINNPISFRTQEGEIPFFRGKQEVTQPSTAISRAVYDPSDDSLNITYTSGDKVYKYKAGGSEGLKEWINAPSKGRITNEWRTTHHYPGY